MHTQATSGLATVEREQVTREDVFAHALRQPQSEPRTQGEIEADVCEVLRRYSLEYMGRGPKDVHAYLLGDLLLVRMTGILTVAEQHLAATTADRGKRLLKQIRSQLIEVARNEMQAMIRLCTCVDVISLHHDISTATGEEIIVFTLDRVPTIRSTRRKLSPSGASIPVLFSNAERIPG